MNHQSHWKRTVTTFILIVSLFGLSACSEAAQEKAEEALSHFISVYGPDATNDTELSDVPVPGAEVKFSVDGISPRKTDSNGQFGLTETEFQLLKKHKGSMIKANKVQSDGKEMEITCYYDEDILEKEGQKHDKGMVMNHRTTLATTAAELEKNKSFDRLLDNKNTTKDETKYRAYTDARHDYYGEYMDCLDNLAPENQPVLEDRDLFYHEKEYSDMDRHFRMDKKLKDLHSNFTDKTAINEYKTKIDTKRDELAPHIKPPKGAKVGGLHTDIISKDSTPIDLCSIIPQWEDMTIQAGIYIPYDIIDSAIIKNKDHMANIKGKIKNLGFDKGFDMTKFDDLIKDYKDKLADESIDAEILSTYVSQYSEIIDISKEDVLDILKKGSITNTNKGLFTGKIDTPFYLDRIKTGTIGAITTGDPDENKKDTRDYIDFGAIDFDETHIDYFDVINFVPEENHFTVGMVPKYNPNLANSDHKKKIAHMHHQYLKKNKDNPDKYSNAQTIIYDHQPTEGPEDMKEIYFEELEKYNDEYLVQHPPE